MKFKSGQAQGGLFDYHARREALSQKATPLDRLSEHIDWELFRTDLAGHLDYKCGPQGGCPPWCPVLMFKILVLQKYYDLSEEQTEFQILDRFSFQRFLGLDVGDKNHIKCNAQSKLIECYTVTSASVHDSQPLRELLTKEDGRLHGDCAYRSAKVDEELRQRGMVNCLHEKSHRDRPLTKRQQQANTKKSRIRARVEHIFGFQVHQMRANWIRTIGKKRAQRSIGLSNLVYNLFRYVQPGGSMAC